jgi:hypothetical protein
MARDDRAMNADLHQTAEEVERYIREHLFGPDGLMYSYIDVRSGKPLEPAAVEHLRRPYRGHDDPATYWTHEDSVLTAGLYMEALVLKLEVTGDPPALEEAWRVWEPYRLVYYASQVFGSGAFLRPYGGFAGGFETMARWAEPLGTDQASPLLSGLYGLWRHASGPAKDEIADIVVATLSWYERQGFRYLWYKALMHEWQSTQQHAGSFYLPALAFAAKVTGDGKWREHLQERVLLFRDPAYNAYETFNWGGDMVMLADLMGPQFREAFPQALLDRGREMWREQRATYTMPGMVRYVCHQNPEVHEPDFEPFTVPRGIYNLEPDFLVHQARERPASGAGSHFLCALARLGDPGALEEAAEVAGHFRQVPEHFTVFLTEDHDRLPEDGCVRLQSRLVGTGMVGWYRNYWALRKARMAAREGQGDALV